jgi:hypothetical protein
MGLFEWRDRWDYRLRQALRLRRRTPVVYRPEPKDGLYADPPELAARAEELRRVYRLDDLFARTGRDNWAENLYYLDWLERCLETADVTLPARVAAVDIGVAHWCYVSALHALLCRHRCPEGRAVTLTGFEIDAWRLHLDLHARHDHALAHMAGLPGVRYVPEGFSAQPAAFDWVSLLFPFVFTADHRRWRLPSRLFEPRRLLDDAWRSVAPGGVLVILNQGDAEHDAQGELLAAAGIPARDVPAGESGLFQYSVSRRGWVAQRG